MSEPGKPATAAIASTSGNPPTTRNSLPARLIMRTVLITACTAVMLLGTAGTWRYWQAWAFLAVSVLPTGMIYAWLARHDPEVAERRLQSGEKVGEQRKLIHVFKALCVVVFLLPGLDYRMGWSRGAVGDVPAWLSVAADLVVLAGIVSVAWVMRINRFAASTIRVEAEQTAVTGGPYAFIRHPMYTASLLILLAAPIALNSWAALPLFALFIPFYVLRLLNEEKVLRAGLPGYTEYCQKTRYRLVPFVW